MCSIELEQKRKVVVQALKSGKLDLIPQKMGKTYDMNMIRQEFCDLHEAYQFFRRK